MKGIGWVRSGIISIEGSNLTCISCLASVCRARHVVGWRGLPIICNLSWSPALLAASYLGRERYLWRDWSLRAAGGTPGLTWTPLQIVAPPTGHLHVLVTAGEDEMR